MNNIKDFKKDQLVKTFDVDDQKTVYGKVLAINEEEEIVEIKWDDLSESILHDSGDFSDIKPVN